MPEVRLQMAQVDYSSILAEAWAQAVAPREEGAPTVISTFAGGGGSLLGYLMAGYQELLAVEWDDNAVATLRLNFPHLDIYRGDIAKLSIEETLERTKLKPGELDVLDGSPPCQGFSTAGKRQMDDPRNGLFREYVRLLRGLQPKVFVMENVSGMVKGKMKLVFAEILQELKASGYRVSARLMNAMYFRVPQSRERMIFIGVREDLKIAPSHPRPANRLIAAGVAIKDADVSSCGQPRELLVDRMKKVKPGSNLSKAECTSSLFSYVRCPIDRPCMTLQKSVTHGGISIWHPTEERNLSIGELKRISSFPDIYAFAGTYEDSVNRMGNSVPPLFMRAIAQHIRHEILDRANN